MTTRLFGNQRENRFRRLSRHTLLSKVPSWGSSRSRKTVTRIPGLLRVFMVQELGLIILSFVPPRDNTNQMSMVEGLCSANKFFRLNTGKFFPRIRCCPTPVEITLPDSNPDNPNGHRHIKLSMHGATMEYEACNKDHSLKEPKQKWSDFWRSMLRFGESDGDDSGEGDNSSKVPEELRVLRDHGLTPIGLYVKELVVFWPRNFLPPPKDLQGAFSECHCLESLSFVGCLDAGELLKTGSVPQSVTSFILEDHVEFGGVVESLGDLRSLQHITFRHCTLAGHAFAELHTLNKLVRFSLTADDLTAVPESVSELTSLEEFDVSSNRISALPASLGKLENLKVIDASHNRIVSLPVQLGNITCLTQLNVSHNRLTVLPEYIGAVSTLLRLNLAHNRIMYLPNRIGDLSNLQVLNVSGNVLVSLPDTIGSLCSLASLNVSRNVLERLPQNLGDLHLLRELDLSSNRLRDIPESVMHLRNLRKLNLSHNYLSLLPDSFGFLENLLRFNVANNNLLALPESIGNAHRLRKVDVSQNRLTALVPSLARLDKLVRLNLSANCLVSLPYWLSRMPVFLAGGVDLSSNHMELDQIHVTPASGLDPVDEDVLYGRSDKGKWLWNMRPRSGCRKCQQ